MSNRMFAYYAAAVGLTLAWFFFAYRPLVVRLAESQSAADRLEQRLEDYRATARELPMLLERQKELQQSKQMLESRLYAKADILSLIGDVKSLAAASGLKVYDITPSMEELLQLNRRARSTEPLFLELAVTVDGRFVDFGAYVASLEEQVFFRGITRCSAHAGKNPGDRIRCTIGFRALLGSTEGPA
ncbi:MAG: type 4a pilus biogenesis protein PilO [candidate division Zixibacteria bacterium]|nr:type 4a pilus biogenesis protein PilO [candidate division Zixibacteria bacterium]